MSARQWEPGDVARVGIHRWMRVEGDRWVNELGSFIHGTAHVSIHYACRPLVAIDPEDREQVEHLWKALDDQVEGASGFASDLQAALRSLVADPKPAEPQGLGAVVEDVNEVRWIRTTSLVGIGEPDSPFAVWARDNALTGTARQTYDRIAVVKVLSEGVTA